MLFSELHAHLDTKELHKYGGLGALFNFFFIFYLFYSSELFSEYYF